MNEPKWLVRSGGMILGPFNKEEVGNRIVTKEFTGLDEAALPRKNWKSLRELPEFQTFLRNVDDKKGADGDTGTADVDITQTFTVSQEVDPIDLTQEITAPQEIVYDDVKEEVIAPQKRGSSTAVRTYGMEGSRQAREQAAKDSRPLWFVVFACILFGGGYFSYHNLIREPSRKMEQSKVDLSVARSLLSQGRYKMALEKFDEVYRADPNNTKVYLYLATLKLQLENDTLIPKQLYAELTGNAPVLKKLANTGMGLAHLMDNELGLAEFRFRESLAVDKNYHPALINIGLKEMLAGNWNGALDAFKKANNVLPDDPMTLIHLGRANIELAKAVNNKAYLKASKQLIGKMKAQGNIFYQEALLLEIYVHLMEKNKDKAEKMLEDFLDVNPYVSENYRYNLFISQQFASWKGLSSYCSEIIANLGESHITKAFEAFCQAKAGQYNIAKTVIEDAVARAPRNALVQGVYSYILMKMGLKIEASVALGSANKNNRKNEYLLPHVMQANFCANNKEWDCAEREWSYALEKNVKDLAAITGLGEASLEMGNASRAINFLNKAKSITEDYVPLQVLAAKMGQ